MNDTKHLFPTKQEIEEAAVASEKGNYLPAKNILERIRDYHKEVIARESYDPTQFTKDMILSQNRFPTAAEREQEEKDATEFCKIHRKGLQEAEKYLQTIERKIILEGIIAKIKWFQMRAAA